jgi:hypothetical protein
MTDLTSVSRYFQTVWDDFVVKDTDSYETDKLLLETSATEMLEQVALSYQKYNAYDLKGYGVGEATRGITEQEAYDIWIQVYQSKQRIFRRQMDKVGVLRMPQSVYDGLFFYYFITDKLLEVHSGEGIYNMRNSIIDKDWNTVASMIMRSVHEKQKCIRAATILRLADYGKTKNRSRLRSDGIFEMRRANEIGAIRGNELKRARFAYYAETGSFLPQTPDGIKRDIAKRYEENVIYKVYEYNANKTYELLKTPSMTPVEKLEVKVNDSIIQHLFDYTLDGNTLTITKELQSDDVIYTKIII